ncbi:hypothetical protein F2Q69_00012935 [Brassica cretica]|uniref:Uncharacterized protein n=1 Tax=Brassica cretica TaxID=69181 RepID=A0A8S9R1Z2_BRACR|nr:hypothetical protein F2Q69_00012935 [Brassica cretica]
MIAPYPLYRLDNRILEIMQGPEDRLGTQRLQVGPERCALNPKVSSFLEYGLLESGDHFRNPEVFVRTRRSSKNPEIYLDHEIIFLGPEGHRGTQRFPFRSWDHDWSPYAVWEPEDSSIGPETVLGTWRNPKVLLWILRSFAWNPEAIWEPGGTVLRLPRQDYYRHMFGFRILPLGSWPLSSSYVVFYICRISLTSLEGAGVGVMTQVPGFAASHVWLSRDYERPRCALGCTGVLGLARIRGLWRPDPARMPL